LQILSVLGQVDLLSSNSYSKNIALNCSVGALVIELEHRMYCS
jgi:hypothetical protein